jgi:hypothetical protein
MTVESSVLPDSFFAFTLDGTMTRMAAKAYGMVDTVHAARIPAGM